MILKTIEIELTKQLGKKVGIHNSRSISGGCINNALKLETNCGNFFLKWNAQGKSDMFIREKDGLDELAKALKGDILIPKVLCAKEISETPGFLVQEYLIPGSSSPENDEKLGRGLALMHSYKKDRFGFYTNNYCGATPQQNLWRDSWGEFFSTNRLQYLLDLIQKERNLPIYEIEMYNKLIDKIPQLLPENADAVLIHGDLWSGNYMITKNGPALIDPAVYYADREMEFAIITMFGGFSSRFYSAYNEVNPLLPDWRDRNQLYQLYHVLNHYLLFGGEYQQQASSIARRFL